MGGEGGFYVRSSAECQGAILHFTLRERPGTIETADWLPNRMSVTDRPVGGRTGTPSTMLATRRLGVRAQLSFHRSDIGLQSPAVSRLPKMLMAYADTH